MPITIRRCLMTGTSKTTDLSSVFRRRKQTGSTLIIRYTKPYTINGLDSATASTMPALYDVVLLDGAAWIACLVRAAGRVETINMNADVIANFELMAQHFMTAFEAGMANLERRPPPVSERAAYGWSV